MTSETTSPETLNERIKRKWFGVEAVDRMLGMTALDRTHRLAERLARKMQDGTLGRSESFREQPEDDMSVQVGDNTVTHHHHEPQPTSMSGLKKAALAAALLGAGGGLGAGVPFVVDAMRPSTAPIVTPADSDTLYELHIGGEQ